MHQIRMELITKIYNLLIAHDIDSIYDGLSNDEHRIILEENNVIVYEAFYYGYADIIGLTNEEFSILEYIISISKE